MKKIFLIITLFLMIFLFGCNLGHKVLDNEYNYIRRSYSSNSITDSIIIKSIEDMVMFLEEEPYLYNDEALKEYDDSFFKNKSLIIVPITTGSGGDYYKITSYKIIYQKIILDVKLINKGVTCDLGRYFMILEISTSKIKNVNKISINNKK